MEVDVVEIAWLVEDMEPNEAKCAKSDGSKKEGMGGKEERKDLEDAYGVGQVYYRSLRMGPG